jgi:hypothetical protein
MLRQLSVASLDNDQLALAIQSLNLFERINLVWDLNMLLRENHIYSQQKDTNRQRQAQRCVNLCLELFLIVTR